MIDKLYSKEIKFVYTNQNLREDCVGKNNIIFDLFKSHGMDLVPRT